MSTTNLINRLARKQFAAIFTRNVCTLSTSSKNPESKNPKKQKRWRWICLPKRIGSCVHNAYFVISLHSDRSPITAFGCTTCTVYERCARTSQLHCFKKYHVFVGSVLHDHRNGVREMVMFATPATNALTIKWTRKNEIKSNTFHFCIPNIVLFYFCVIHVCRSRTSAMSNAPQPHIFETGTHSIFVYITCADVGNFSLIFGRSSSSRRAQLIFFFFFSRARFSPFIPFSPIFDFAFIGSALIECERALRTCEFVCPSVGSSCCASHVQHITFECSPLNFCVLMHVVSYLRCIVPMFLCVNCSFKMYAPLPLCIRLPVWDQWASINLLVTERRSLVCRIVVPQSRVDVVIMHVAWTSERTWPMKKYAYTTETAKL